MPTTKDRINITISKSDKKFLQGLAKRDEMPLATKARLLFLMALEIEEDSYWSKLAAERDVPGVKYISHKQAWRNV